MGRLLPWMLGLCLLTLATRPARAESVVLVLDRGQGARGSAALDARTALRLAERVSEHGLELRVYAVGARQSGLPRVVELTLPLSAAALSELDGMEGTSFDGPSDVRAALAAALRGGTPKEPLRVVLLGPFGRVEPVPEGAVFALDTWARTAPKGSTLVALAPSPEASAALAGAHGLVPSGRILLAARPRPPRLEAWSAWDPDARLSARLELAVEDLTWGTHEAAAAPFALTPEASDAVESHYDAGTGLIEVVLRRALAAGLATSAAWQAQEQAGTWSLVAPLEPIALSWWQLTPDARWLDAEAASRGLIADDLLRERPRLLSLRYRRTEGPFPLDAPTARSPFATLGTPPAGLQVTVLPERRLSAALVEGVLELRAHAPATLPLASAGTVTVRFGTDADAALLEVPYRLASAPGEVALRLERPWSAPQPLPRAAADAPWRLTLEARNANAPPEVTLVWACEPSADQVSLALHVLGERGGAELWRAGEPRAFAVGRGQALEVVPTSQDEPALADGELRFTSLGSDGTHLDAEARATWRRRRPRLQLEPGSVGYVGNAKDPSAERAVRLSVDADGGDGAWLARLLDAPLSLRSPAEQAFSAIALGPGRYELRRTGPWRGARADPFSARSHWLALEASLPGVTPWRGDVPVHVPARWGRMGWVLLGLAAAGLLLACWALWVQRPEPVRGLLLYTTQGVEGAVGRLPLAGVGRRRTALTASAAGRLALDGPGTLLAWIVPTRLGGLLQIPGEAGAHARRLLVEGLTIRLGRHALRYVGSGGEDPALVPATVLTPDLLGPEYDLPYESGAPGRSEAS